MNLPFSINTPFTKHLRLLQDIKKRIKFSGDEIRKNLKISFLIVSGIATIKKKNENSFFQNDFPTNHEFV